MHCLSLKSTAGCEWRWPSLGSLRQVALIPGLPRCAWFNYAWVVHISVFNVFCQRIIKTRTQGKAWNRGYEEGVCRNEVTDVVLMSLYHSIMVHLVCIYMYMYIKPDGVPDKLCVIYILY